MVARMDKELPQCAFPPLRIVSVIISFGRAGGKDTPTQSILLFSGGSAGNTAIGLSRLGVKTSYIACVGADKFGTLQIEASFGAASSVSSASCLAFPESAKRRRRLLKDSCQRRANWHLHCAFRAEGPRLRFMYARLLAQTRRSQPAC
jgi:hypothetical protein